MQLSLIQRKEIGIISTKQFLDGLETEDLISVGK